MEDRRGALWIGTMRGLHRRSADGRAEPIAHSPLPDAWPIHALLEDRDGRVWVGTRYAGVFLLAVDPASHRPTVTRVYDGRRDLPTNWITTIVQSADGAVWVGTNRGVIQFLKDTGRDAYRIRVYSTSEETDEVWAIAEDRQHNLWLGRSHVGVAKLWNRGLTKFAAPDGLSWATSINATRTGDLIAMGGVDRMLSRFDGTKFVASRFPIPGVTPGWGWSQTVLQDRTGDWWIGTGQGLFRFTNLETIDDVPRSSPTPIACPRRSRGSPGVSPLRGLGRRHMDRDDWRAEHFRALALAAEDRHLPSLHDGGWSSGDSTSSTCFLRRRSSRTRVDRVQRARRTGASSGRAFRALHLG